MNRAVHIVHISRDTTNTPAMDRIRTRRRASLHGSQPYLGPLAAVLERAVRPASSRDSSTTLEETRPIHTAHWPLHFPRKFTVPSQILHAGELRPPIRPQLKVEAVSCPHRLRRSKLLQS